jgi:aspartate/methionine/tyrosine aminotransferase
MPWQQTKDLIDLAERHNGSYISDEIYHGLNFDEPDHTALEHSERAFVVNSFSKYFSMTGWRLGWLIVPEAYVAAAEMMAQHFYLSPPDLSQQAALACFEPETLAICEARRLELKARRDYLLPALESIGFSVPFRPDGGFYIFADASRYTADGYQFCLDLLEHAGVSVAPGIDFGPYPQFIRFSYCTRLERLQEAVERIRRYIQNA